MTRRHLLALPLLSALLLSGCFSESGSSAAEGGAGDWSDDTLSLDYATYNPLSLIIRDQGWLEEQLGDDVQVEWVQSAGSNRANEALRAHAIDVGSTAGSAALLARANGSAIKTISLYSQPEWAALVAPAGSDITEVSDLRGKSIAATKGTDPYFFLLQALAEGGVELSEVEVQNLQHADGKTALENGAVDAWSGLDPLMAASVAEADSELFYRNIDFNTYGFLNATESFITDSPDLAQLVVDTYERARVWAIENPDETVRILAEVAAIDEDIAAQVINERTVLDLDPVPGAQQREVLEFVGTIFVDSGDVREQSTVDEALDSLFDTSFVERADPARAGG